jgi:hypothetical protein
MRYNSKLSLEILLLSTNMSDTLIFEHNGKRLLGQTSVPPDTTKLTRIGAFQTHMVSPTHTCGTNVLLLVPTENKFKTKVLEQKLRKELKGAELITRQYKVDTGVKQPYDEMGERCLLERIEATLRYAETNTPLFEENNIGTVVIGGIENYIRVSDSNDNATDFGIVMLYNATTRKAIHGISRGITVPDEYLLEAKQRGCVDSQRKGGRVTVGTILKERFDEPARRKFGNDYDISKDWHLAVSGESRYGLLESVVNGLGRIL